MIYNSKNLPEISVQTGHSHQAQTNQSNQDIILKEEDEIDLESDQDENQVIDDIKNEEIESEDDLEFDVKREPNGKSNSYTRDSMIEFEGVNSLKRLNIEI